MAASALLFFGALVAAGTARQWRRAAGPRGARILAVVGMALATVVLLRSSADYVAGQLNVDRALVEPPVLGYLAPLAVGAFAFVVGAWVLKGAWATGQAFRFYVWLVAFTFANVINWCSPGWCVTIGFPVPWYSSSDSVVTLGASEALARAAAIGQVALGATLDCLAFLGVAYAVARRRAAARPA